MQYMQYRDTTIQYNSAHPPTYCQRPETDCCGFGTGAPLLYLGRMCLYKSH
jgi:hypothetical protein